MALEMKVPSPGESITEVEIAEWLVEDGDYVEKDQAIAEVDSDKATLELPAEASGIITFKAEEGDAVKVGEVVCLIDTDAKKPGSDSSEETSDKKEEKTDDKEEKEDKKKEDDKAEAKTETPSKPSTPDQKQDDKNYASGTPSPAAKKILSEKDMDAKD
ncbi:MAG: biotin/lipoyl-containing protein, partial [Mesonia sp.]